MTWNHRVVLRRWPLHKSERSDPTDERERVEVHGIHEVYYDEKNRPNGCTMEPVSVSSDEGIEGIKWVLDQMQKAVAAPVLDYDTDFVTTRSTRKRIAVQAKRSK